MRFAVSLGENLLLTAEQLERVVIALDGSESIVREWVRDLDNGKGGSIEKINTPKMTELLTCKPMSDVEYDALVTFTALHNNK